MSDILNSLPLRTRALFRTLKEMVDVDLCKAGTGTGDIANPPFYHLALTIEHKKTPPNGGVFEIRMLLKPFIRRF